MPAYLKASALGRQPSYYSYSDEGWAPISKARFDRLMGNGRFYKHELACSGQEFIYNRKR